MVYGFFLKQGIGYLKRDLIKKEKVGWPESVVWFFKGSGITFWTVMDTG